MYDRILVPTDGGANMRPVVAEAAGLADLTGATLHALSVVDAGATTGVGAATRETTADALTDLAEEAVADVAAWADGVPVETAVRHGAPHREILAYAEEADVDTIVMGTHGRTGLGRVLLGSVAERVIRLSDVPVTTVNVDTPDAVVGSESDAEDAARDALADSEHAFAGLAERPFRERSTWVVPVETEAGATVNVHVDAATGDTRVGSVR